ncbi:hypothetical protein V8D89_009339 [Ganoderma adspersum]
MSPPTHLVPTTHLLLHGALSIQGWRATQIRHFDGISSLPGCLALDNRSAQGRRCGTDGSAKMIMSSGLWAVRPGSPRQGLERNGSGVESTQQKVSQQARLFRGAAGASPTSESGDSQALLEHLENRDCCQVRDPRDEYGAVRASRSLPAAEFSRLIAAPRSGHGPITRDHDYPLPSAAQRPTSRRRDVIFLSNAGGAAGEQCRKMACMSNAKTKTAGRGMGISGGVAVRALATSASAPRA